MTDIAKTLKGLPNHPIVRDGLSGKRPLDELVEEYNGWWQANLLDRKPSLVYTETDSGEPFYTTGSLDLFTVMMTLAENKQVISIENYQRMREKQTKAKQRVTDPNRRYGQVKGLTSNKTFHSFSALIWDLSVETYLADGTSRFGADRNFAIVDVFGETRPEYESGTVNFDATKEQVEFLQGRGMEMLDASVEFENFVHPQLYKASFGQRYAVGKVLVELIGRERTYWSGVEARVEAALKKSNISLKGEVQRRKGSALGPWTNSKDDDGEVEKTISVDVPNLEVVLSMPSSVAMPQWYGLDEDGEKRELSGDMESLSEDELKDLGCYIYKRKNKLSHVLGRQVKAPLRAVDLALFQKLTEDAFLKKLYIEDPVTFRTELARCEAKLAGVTRSVGWAVPEPEFSKIKRTQYQTIGFQNGYAMNYRLKTNKTKVVESELSE